MTDLASNPSPTILRGGRLRGLLRRVTHPGEFLRSVRTLMTGTVFSQVLLIAVSPVLTRLYSPDDFGKLAVFAAIAGMVGIFATMRYHYALVLADDEREVAKLLDLCVRIAIAVSATTMVCGLIFLGASAYLGRETRLGWLTLLIPVIIFTNSVGGMLACVCNRRKSYRTIANGSIAQASMSTGVNLVVGYLNPAAFGLILGQVLASIANTSILAYGTSRGYAALGVRLPTRLIGGTPRNELIAVAKKYKKFPKFDIWTDLANVGSIQLPILMIALFFTDALAGLLVLSQRVVGLPMTIVGSALGQVFFQKASELRDHRKELQALLKKVYRGVFLIGLVPTMLIVGWGDIIFSITFGESWRDAGIIAQLLAPAFLFQFVASPLSSLFWVDQSQEKALGFCVALLAGRSFAVLLPCLLGFDFFMCAALYSLIGCILWLSFCILILEQRSVPLMPVLLETAVWFLASGTLVLLIRWAFPHQ